MYVHLPNEDEHGMILIALARNKPINVDIDLVAIGRSEKCANLSGVDLSSMVHVFLYVISAVNHKDTKCIEWQINDSLSKFQINDAAMATLDERLVKMKLQLLLLRRQHQDHRHKAS